MPKPVVQEGDDPDPTPYLFVSLEQKRIDQSKPYDGKKACWVPDDKEGFVQGEIKATKGDLVTVNLPGGEVKFPDRVVEKLMNPTRDFKCRWKRSKQNFKELPIEFKRELLNQILKWCRNWNEWKIFPDQLNITGVIVVIYIVDKQIKKIENGIKIIMQDF